MLLWSEIPCVTFQAVWKNFAFIKKLISLFKKLQFLSGGDALYLNRCKQGNENHFILMQTNPLSFFVPICSSFYDRFSA